MGWSEILWVGEGLKINIVSLSLKSIIMAASLRWEELVGPTLLKANGEEVPTSLALSGKKYVMYVR